MAQKQDSSSYIDGVSVKIAERYKPPKQISPALSYSQRLQLNKVLDNDSATYDFSLEMSVKEKMQEWRNARRLVREERQRHLDKLNVSQTLKNVDQITESLDKVMVNNGDQSPTLYSKNSHTPPVMRTQNTILTPVPLYVDAGYYTTTHSHSPQKRPFNLSDFESDTSSPFDNMELKTINDLEELAQVLQHDIKPAETSLQPSNYTDQTNYFYYPNSTQSQGFSKFTSSVNGCYESLPTFQHFDSRQTSSRIDNTVARVVPDIMKALQEDLAASHVHARNEQKKTDMIKGRSEASQERSRELDEAATQNNEDLDDPFNKLNQRLQQLARKISLMGFPQPRVARACQLIGDDHKKVVEYLLAMSDLLDLGFTEKQVAQALMKFNNDRDKALDYLIS